MLITMQTHHFFISYSGFISQLYFYLFFGCIDNFLLAVMAYDRYVAICHPLYYTSIKREGVCVLLVVGSWIFSCGSALLPTLLLVRVSFCPDNIIPHFLCSLSFPLNLLCSNTSVNEVVIFTEGVMAVTFPLSGILVCYGHIGASILRVPLPKGLQSQSTCGSHLSAVSLFYGTIMVL